MLSRPVGDEIAVEFTASLPPATVPLTGVVRSFHSKVRGIEFVPKTAAEECALDELRNELRRDAPFLGYTFQVTDFDGTFTGNRLFQHPQPLSQLIVF